MKIKINRKKKKGNYGVIFLREKLPESELDDKCSHLLSIVI